MASRKIVKTKHATDRGGTRVLPMDKELPRGQEDKQPLRTINKDCRLMKPPGIKEQQFIGKPLIALWQKLHTIEEVCSGAETN